MASPKNCLQPRTCLLRCLSSSPPESQEEEPEHVPQSLRVSRAVASLPPARHGSKALGLRPPPSPQAGRETGWVAEPAIRKAGT